MLGKVPPVTFTDMLPLLPPLHCGGTAFMAIANGAGSLMVTLNVMVQLFASEIVMEYNPPDKSKAF